MGWARRSGGKDSLFQTRVQIESAEVEASREHGSRGGGCGALGSGRPAWEEGSCLQGVQSGWRVPVTPTQAGRGGGQKGRFTLELAEFRETKCKLFVWGEGCRHGVWGHPGRVVYRLTPSITTRERPRQTSTCHSEDPVQPKNPEVLIHTHYSIDGL